MRFCCQIVQNIRFYEKSSKTFYLLISTDIYLNTFKTASCKKSLKNNSLTFVFCFTHTVLVRQRCHVLTIKQKGNENDRISLYHSLNRKRLPLQKGSQTLGKYCQGCSLCILGESSCIINL